MTQATQRMQRPTVAVATLLVAALTGCAGPTSHVSIVGKQEPLAVAFGTPSTLSGHNPTLSPVPSGLGVLPVRSTGSAVVYIDVPGGGVPTPAPPACPKANPLSAPKEVAENTITNAAPNGTYTYRFAGTAIAGAVAHSFSGLSKHVVTSSAAGQGAYRFDVAVTMLGATTTYSYLVTPAAGTAANVNGPIELASVNGNGGYGYDASFKPDKPLEVFTQPANAGATWTDAETDAESATYATVNGTIDGKERVDACGTPLDAWRTTTTLAITSPNEQITATVQTWWGTQFGGLPLAETQTYSGKAGGVDVRGSVTSTISVDPAAVHR